MGEGFADRTADQRPEAGNDFVDREGFAEIVIRSEVEAFDPFIDLAPRSEYEDRGSNSALPKAAEDAEAITSREHDVEDDRVEVFAQKSGKGFVAMVDDIHCETLCSKSGAEEGCDLFFILDD